MNTLVKGQVVMVELTSTEANVQRGLRPCVIVQNNIGNKYLTPNKNIKIMIKNKKIFFTRYCKLP